MYNWKRLAFISICLLPIAELHAGSPRDFIATPDEPHGLVVTSIDRVANNIYSTLIIAINGQELSRRQDALWLKPGEYSIKAINKTGLNRNFVPGIRGDFSKDSITPLSLNVEAGKTYYVGLKADSGRRSDWQLVVWQIEDQD